MSLISVPGPLPPAVAVRYPFGYAVVDVETSGLNAACHRVLQIAVCQVRADGGVESTWSTLLDPGCDPGPVEIHGLTRERLAGSPLYADVAPVVARMLAGRVVVAHNASFDWRFLTAEAERAHSPLAASGRLCTLALTRRLDVPVTALSLAAVAGYWGVPQLAAHNAEDDVRVLVEVLRHSLVVACRLGIDLPVATADRQPRRVNVYPAAAPRPPCAWRFPGPYRPGGQLRQGMKVVFTGETATPREKLIRSAVSAGLDVMNSVSSRTSLLVSCKPAEDTVKARQAALHRTTVVTEQQFLALLQSVQPGEPKPTDAPPPRRDTRARLTPAPNRAPVPEGRLVRRRVLVVGGSHDDAAAVRARVTELGGQAAANVTTSVTDVVALTGHESDSRWARLEALNLPRLDPETLQPLPVLAPTTSDQDDVELRLTNVSPRPSDLAEPIVLPRGGVTDLPDVSTGWVLSVTWPDTTLRPGLPDIVVDVAAFVTDADEQVTGDEDFCFYNQPEHPTGAVALELDTPHEALVLMRPELLPPASQRVIVAAGIDGEATFGDLGPIELTLRSAEGEPVVRATLDAASRERSMLLAFLYPRNGAWRFRVVGQGYRDGLHHLAVLHGVDVED